MTPWTRPTIGYFEQTNIAVASTTGATVGWLYAPLSNDVADYVIARLEEVRSSKAIRAFGEELARAEAMRMKLELTRPEWAQPIERCRRSALPRRPRLRPRGARQVLSLRARPGRRPPRAPKT